MRPRRPVIRADVAILDDDAAAPIESSERRQHGAAGHLDYRLRRQSGLELLEEPRRRSTVPIARARQADPEGEAIVRLDAGRLASTARKLRSVRPAPTRSIDVNATSTTMRPKRNVR